METSSTLCSKRLRGGASPSVASVFLHSLIVEAASHTASHVLDSQGSSQTPWLQGNCCASLTVENACATPQLVSPKTLSWGRKVMVLPFIWWWEGALLWSHRRSFQRKAPSDLSLEAHYGREIQVWFFIMSLGTLSRLACLITRFDTWYC